MRAKLLGLTFVGLFCASILQAQTATNSWLGGDGYWTNAVQWDSGNAPSSADLILITNFTSAYTVVIDGGTPGSQLTNWSWNIGRASSISPVQTLSVSNAVTPLIVQSNLTLNRGGMINLVDSSLYVATIPTLTGMNANVVSIAGSFNMSGNGLTFQVMNPGVNVGLAFISSTQADTTNVISGTTVVVTNNIANFPRGQISVGSGSQTRITTLLMSNTPLFVNAFQVSAGGNVRIDNRGVTTTNLAGFTVSSLGNGTTGVLVLVGGKYRNVVSLGASGGVSIFTNQGAEMIVGGSIAVGNAGNSKSIFVLDGGTNIHLGNSVGFVTVANVANSTGTLTVLAGVMNVNQITLGNGAGSRGDFELLGGTIAVTSQPPVFSGIRGSLQVGPVGDGRYRQTGGTLSAGTLILGTNAQEFTVGPAGVIRITQTNGFRSGMSPTLGSMFDFDGSLVFAPDPTVRTQLLQLAGMNLGGNTSGYSNNFSLGTLDLTGLSPSNRVELIAPSGLPNPALYVGAITPLATGALISAFNVFYLPELNPSLFFGAPQGTYLLAGGGFLLPIPEPATAALLPVGGLLLALVRCRIR